MQLVCSALEFARFFELFLERSRRARLASNLAKPVISSSFQVAVFFDQGDRRASGRRSCRRRSPRSAVALRAVDLDLGDLDRFGLVCRVLRLLLRRPSIAALPLSLVLCSMKVGVSSSVQLAGSPLVAEVSIASVDLRLRRAVAAAARQRRGRGRRRAAGRAGAGGACSRRCLSSWGRDWDRRWARRLPQPPADERPVRGRISGRVGRRRRCRRRARRGAARARRSAPRAP